MISICVIRTACSHFQLDKNWCSVTALCQCIKMLTNVSPFMNLVNRHCKAVTVSFGQPEQMTEQDLLYKR